MLVFSLTRQLAFFCEQISDNDRQATYPGLLRSGTGGSWTHNIQVTRQNAFHWATAPFYSNMPPLSWLNARRCPPIRSSCPQCIARATMSGTSLSITFLVFHWDNHFLSFVAVWLLWKDNSHHCCAPWNLCPRASFSWSTIFQHSSVLGARWPSSGVLSGAKGLTIVISTIVVGPLDDSTLLSSISVCQFGDLDEAVRLFMASLHSHLTLP